MEQSVGGFAVVLEGQPTSELLLVRFGIFSSR